MRYNLTFNDIATGAVADTYKTVAALLVADTAGHRCRVRSISVGPSDDTPVDANASVKLVRVADVSAGGAGTSTTVAGSAMAKLDPGSADSVVSGGRNYTAEPTTYETEALWQIDLNTRGALVKEWAPEDAPLATQDMLLGLLAAPRAAAAVKVSGTIEFETF